MINEQVRERENEEGWGGEEWNVMMKRRDLEVAVWLWLWEKQTKVRLQRRKEKEKAKEKETWTPPNARVRRVDPPFLTVHSLVDLLQSC